MAKLSVPGEHAPERSSPEGRRRGQQLSGVTGNYLQGCPPTVLSRDGRDERRDDQIHEVYPGHDAGNETGSPATRWGGGLLNQPLLDQLAQFHRLAGQLNHPDQLVQPLGQLCQPVQLLGPAGSNQPPPGPIVAGSQAADGPMHVGSHVWWCKWRSS